MKYLNILILIFLLSACGSTKKAVDNSPKQIAKVETIATPKQEKEIPEIIPPKEDNSTEISLGEESTISDDSITETETTEIIYIEAFDHSIFNNLLQKHVTATGNVDYKGFKRDYNALKNYINLLGTHQPTESWNNSDKLAYWINAYNAMTIDLINRNYPVKSINDIDKPWEQRLWKLGKKWYNLNEIEHQILRKMNEPRIHFAIVCASFSCPKLQNKVFRASSLEEQLTNATKEFLSDSNRNNLSENSLKLSKIFKWFAKDFKQNGSLIDFLNQYADIKISNNAKKSFKDYNWDLND